MSRFDLTGNPGLSAAAEARQRNDPGPFGAQQLEAEALLQVEQLPTFLPAALLPVAQLAVCLQINWQLERGIEPLMTTAKGSKLIEGSVAYRDEVLRDPRAVALMAQVRDGVGLGADAGYATPIRSLRGGQVAAPGL